MEFDALSRLGITDHKVYLKKQLANEKIEYLNSCVVSKNILERLEADIDECISSKSYVDLQSNLPSIFNDKDTQQILELVLVDQKQAQTIIIESYVISKLFIETLSKNCDKLVQEKAKFVVESGRYQQYQVSLQAVHLRPQKSEEFEEKVDKREERRKKAAGGKSGGGTQGRETKTKSTKKGGPRGGNRNVEEAVIEAPEKKSLEIVTREDIRGTFKSNTSSRILENVKNEFCIIYLFKI